MKEDFYISMLMVSRICHDLISSSGALSFALEEMKKNNESNEEIIELALSSSIVLTNRLKYFRAAMGSSFVTESSVLDSMKKLIEDLYQEKKITINWHNENTDSLINILDGLNMKICLNIFLLIFNHVSRNATVGASVVEINSNTVVFMINVKGNTVNIKSTTIDILEGRTDVLESSNPRNIYVYLIYFLMQQTSTTIEFDTNDREVFKVAFSLSSNK